MQTPLSPEKIAPIRMGRYRGAETAAAFTAVAEEFEALRSGAAVYATPWQAKIVVSGEDRVRWLNGMITNNVRDLAAGHGVYSFVLNPQGRIQGDLTAFQRGDYFLLLTDASQAACISALFDRYIIMDDVELADISEKLASLSLKGPQAASVLQSVGLPSALDPGQVVDASWHNLGVSVARTANERFPEVAIWFAPENGGALWNALTNAGAQPVGFEALERFRIASGVPLYGQDIRERDLPQETLQNHALHFAKGCYIGQEIVERIHSRGNVHRMFTGFTLSAPASIGTKLMRDGKELGELTSVTTLPNQPTIALGYVRREAAAPRTDLFAGDTIATVHSIPFEI